MNNLIKIAIVLAFAAQCKAAGNPVKSITDRTTIDSFVLSNCTVNPWMEKDIKKYAANSSKIFQYCLDHSFFHDDMDYARASC